MIFLGNLASAHLSQWRAIYHEIGIECSTLHTIHDAQGIASGFSTIRRVALGASWFSYVLLGLKLRGLRQEGILHAHGGMGYGLAALLSGRPYIVTIYGSEVLGRHSDSYTKVLRRILSSAVAVTVTADPTRDRVVGLGVPAEKVFSFHTGVDLTELAEISPPPASQSMEPAPIRVLSLRNTAPHYRTDEIVVACDAVRRAGYRLRLRIILGNGDRAYFNKLQQEWDRPWIEFVGSSLGHRQMLEEIATAQICVSLPKTDQLSTTLIEAAFYDKPIVTSRLPAYSDFISHLEPSGKVYPVDDIEALVPVLTKAIQKVEQEGSGERGSMRKVVTEQYSLQSAAMATKELLERVGLRANLPGDQGAGTESHFDLQR